MPAPFSIPFLLYGDFMEFWHGLVIGLAYSAPIGIQNLFVINTALTQSKKCAAITAIWVIFFDTVLALACFFGIGAIMQQVKWLKMLILLAGSLIVIYMGASLLRTKEFKLEQKKQSISLTKIISTACVVTWGNPQAIVDGTMMLGAFHAVLPADLRFAFIGGVVAASCLWFSSIVFLASCFSRYVNNRTMRALNLVCGVIIILYGLKLLSQFVGELNL